MRSNRRSAKAERQGRGHPHEPARLGLVGSRLARRFFGLGDDRGTAGQKPLPGFGRVDGPTRSVKHPGPQHILQLSQAFARPLFAHPDARATPADGSDGGDRQHQAHVAKFDGVVGHAGSGPARGITWSYDQTRHA
jgi:hypothetical protein